jgi:hypothetical protein
MDPMVATFDPVPFDVLMKRGHEEHQGCSLLRSSTAPVFTPFYLK